MSISEKFLNYDESLISIGIIFKNTNRYNFYEKMISIHSRFKIYIDRILVMDFWINIYRNLRNTSFIAYKPLEELELI